MSETNKQRKGPIPNVVGAKPEFSLLFALSPKLLQGLNPNMNTLEAEQCFFSSSLCFSYFQNKFVPPGDVHGAFGAQSEGRELGLSAREMSPIP